MLKNSGEHTQVEGQCNQIVILYDEYAISLNALRLA